MRIRVCAILVAVAACQTDSTTNSDPPFAPSELSALPTAPQSITVFWNDRSADETQFVIEFARGTEIFAPLAVTPSNVTSYPHANAERGQTYRYRVRACRGTTCSAWVGSVEVSIVTTLADPPTVIAATARPHHTSATVEAVVNPNGVATLVTVRYAASSTIPFSPTHTSIPVPIGNGTTPVAVTIPLTSLLPETQYIYRVVAENAAGANQDTRFGGFATTNDPSKPVVINASVTGPAKNVLTLHWDVSNCSSGSWNMRSLDPPGQFMQKFFADIGPKGSTKVDFYNVFAMAYEFRLYFCGQTKLVTASGTRVPPPTLSASVTANSVVLTWNDVMSGTASYIVERETVAPYAFDWFTPPAGATSLTDTNVVRGRTYRYKIRSDRSTEFSDWVAVTVP